jgi:hypothetical protein
LGTSSGEATTLIEGLRVKNNAIIAAVTSKRKPGSQFLDLFMVILLG